MPTALAMRREAAVSSGTRWPTAGWTCEVGPKTETEAMATLRTITGTATMATEQEQPFARAINRNFPGRSGPGKVYLASPLVVAASAIAGHIVGPDTL